MNNQPIDNLAGITGVKLSDMLGKKNEYKDWLLDEKKRIANELGMTFNGMKDGDPEFIGTEKQWGTYMQVLDSLIEEQSL